jgi:PEP-CTERM motif
MKRSYIVLAKKWFRVFASVSLVGLCFPSVARAGMVLAIAADVRTDIDFQGTGTGASFVFNNNSSGDAFTITGSSGVGDSVGLQGTIGGTFSYTVGSIVTAGQVQTAPVITSNGTLTITDASLISLTGTLTGIDVATIGTAGAVDVNGAINLTNVSYSGTNSDLLELKNEAAAGGGIVAISFQFVPGESLTTLAASGPDQQTSYSGTITASVVPEPASLSLGCIALGTIVLGMRWRKSRRHKTKR